MNQFKALREKTGLRQQDVSEKLNVTQSTIAMWETGKNRPRADLLPKIAALYGCTVDELLGSGKPVGKEGEPCHVH